MPINAEQIEAFQNGYDQAVIDLSYEYQDKAPPTKWTVRITFESGRIMHVSVTSVEKPHYSGKTNWWQIKPETQVNMSKVESVTVTKRAK